MPDEEMTVSNVADNDADAGQESVADSQENEPESVEPDGGADESAEDSAPVTQKPKRQRQSVEDNRAAAAARKAEQQRMDAFARDEGYTNFAEYEKARKEQRKEEQDAAKRQRYYDTYGVNYDAMREMTTDLLQSDPRLVALEETNRSLALKEAETRELARLHAEFPETATKIKTIDDLDNLAINPADKEYANELLGKGYEIADVYLIVNRSSIMAEKAKAARQTVLNDQNSKAHVKPTGEGVAVKEIVVPPETLAIYRKMFPKWNDEKIRAHYKTTL